MRVKRSIFTMILLLIFAAALVIGARFVSFAITPISSSAQPVIIEIRKGQGPTEITRTLVRAGIVTDEMKFRWLGRIFREWKNVKAGEYEVSSSMTPLQVFGRITSGISVNHSVTVREGQNIYEFADELSAKGLGSRDRVLALCRDRRFMRALGMSDPLPPTLEGYLYPETYFINRTMTEEDILRQMVRKFQTIWTEEYQARAEILGLSRHQTVTLASMIEKETGAPHERPLISSVFHNRLKKRMRLQSDPTTIYGMWERYKGNIRRDDLLEKNDYNTYSIPALPVGPIGNPGKEALRAALYPAASEYYYFVSRNDGTHRFTSNLSEHTAAVREFQLNAKARQGKSWRDLSKRTNPE